MKEFGEVKSMLGIQVTKNPEIRRMFLHQSDYATLLLQGFQMQNSKPMATRVDQAYLKDVDLQANYDAASFPYREAIGSLMYSMIGTRPGLAFAVGKLSQKCRNPTAKDWKAVKRVLPYISATLNYMIIYQDAEEWGVSGYSDSDWAGCRESRKSVSGFVFLCARGTVSWRSKKQTVVAKSSCEAEYVALSYPNSCAVLTGFSS